MVAQTVPPAGVASSHLTAASCPTNYPAAYGTPLNPTALTYTYNSLGEEVGASTPPPAGQTSRQTSTATYDSAGLPVTETFPPSSNTPGAPAQVISLTYDADGNVLSQTTGTGTSASTLAYCYDANGNQTSSIAADGNATALAPCNTNSSFPGIVDPTAYPTQANYQTTYKYDSVGELVSSTSPVTAAAPAGATTTYRYDAAQDQVSTTDPNGVTASSTYNSAGEMTGVTYSGSAAHSVSYTYDPEGSITSMVDATGTSTYSFDPFGELTSATNGAGKTVGYGYNSDGATTAITYPLPASATWATSPTVSYGYDAAGLLTSVTDFNGKKITIASNNNGEPATETLAATGDTITTDYDQTGSPSAINLKNGTTTLLGFSYAEAPSGSVLTETDTPSSSQPTTTYTYDSLGRVTSTTQGTAPTAHYLFDNSGNLTTTPTGAAGSYDFAGELTSATAAGTATNYTYDADGQQLSAKQGTTTLSSGTWDGAGDLNVILRSSGGDDRRHLRW